MKIIIFGANDTGYLLASQFFKEHDITIINDGNNPVEDIENLDINITEGNPSNINLLKKIHIEQADIFIACSNVDEANIVASLVVHKLSKAKIACFVSNQEHVESLALMQNEKGAIIDNIIHPEDLLTKEIFQIITVPEAIKVENFAKGKAKLLEYRIKKDSSLLNKAIKDCTFAKDTVIVGISRNSKLFIPNGSTVFEEEDKVIFIGLAESLGKLVNLVSNDFAEVKTAGIIGGGTVGLMLAQKLEKAGLKTKIIEKNLERCEFLTENLKNTLVLNGDGTNLELLNTEDFGECDVIISVTNNDEKNLLCSLLAKQLGAKRVITRVSKPTNVSLFEKVGIDVAISPKESAIHEIVNTLIKTNVDILASVEQGQGEIIDIDIPDYFKDKKISELKMPERAIISIIQRASKIIIPTGNTLVRPEDKLIIFTMAEQVDNIKNFFERR